MPKLKKLVKRGLDCLEPGQLIVIKFPGAMDDMFDSNRDTEEKEQKLKDYIESCPCLPAVILKKKYVSYMYGDVCYDVGFRTRWIWGGNISGTLVLKDTPIWRYFAKNEGEPVEGIPPTWLINGIKDEIKKENYHYFEELCNDELFYVVDSDYVDEDGQSNYAERIYLKDNL